MSHNITIIGYGMYPWQTPTSITRYVLSESKGKSPIEKDLNAIELLRQWTHQIFDPQPLKNKDSRNPYLINQRIQKINEIDEKIDKIKNFIILQQSSICLVISN